MAMPQSSMSTVASYTISCLESFQTCLEKAAAIHPREVSLVEDQIARFSIWASNIGVFATDRGSLDYRVHEASDVKDAITGLLEELDVSVHNCSDIIDTLTPQIPSRKLLEIDEKLDQCLRNIADEIGLLHKLSNTIRKASKETQDEKAEKTFIIRDDEGRDAGSFLQSIFFNYVRDRYGKIPEPLQQRLAKTMLLRRKRILYRRSRYGKHSIRAPKIPLRLSVQRLQTRTQLGISEKASDEPDQRPVPSSAPKTTAKSVTQSVAQSATQTATTLSPESFLKMASSPSAISSSKTVALSSHEELRFPPAPCGTLRMRYKKQKRQLEEFHKSTHGSIHESPGERPSPPSFSDDWSEFVRAVGELTCPFCSNDLPVQQVTEEKKWSLHVMGDLDPYVCLFEECDKPEKIYSHSEQWLNHMREHALRWRCSSKLHGELIYNTRDEYLKHMMAGHGGKFTEAQLETLARKNARKIGPIFPSCPLCHEFNDTDGDVEHHVVGHMRSLALKSLPSYEEDLEGLSDFDSDDESLGTSRPRTRSTIHQLSSSYNDSDIVDFRSPENPQFTDYIHEKEKIGIDIDQNPLKYITEDVLREYWTVAEVSKILQASHGEPIASTVDAIGSSYIRVWSTLVFIGHPIFINWFRKNDRDDKFFAITGFDAAIYRVQNPSLSKMLEGFGKHWWKFWPVQFTLMHQREFDSNRVLPITSYRKLSQETSLPGTTIYEVDLDPSCCGYHSTKVVFKVYNAERPEASRAFAKEVDIFDTLGHDCRDVIVEYLGSFIQNGKRVVVMEHANGGNLGNFFQEHRRPRDNKELIDLWSKLFKLVEAIYHLHHPGRFTAGIAHGDIKFENILYFKKESDNDFDFEFKLTDFDTSTPLQRTQNGSSRKDNDGSRTHCAPEASRIRVITETKSEQVPLISDMWQLGTVFSEALICILWDVKALEEYEQRRRRETKLFPDLVNSGLENCFHDGQKRLTCIQAVHQEALGSRARYDGISELVVALIENEMLVPHDHRAQPRQLMAKFENLLAQFTSGSTTQERPQNAAAKNEQRHHEPIQAQRYNTMLDAMSTDQSITDQEILHGADNLSTRFAERDSNLGQGSGRLNHHDAIENLTTPLGGIEITNESYGEASSENEKALTTNVDSRSLVPSKEPSKIPVLTTSDVDLWRKQKSSWKKGGKLPEVMSDIVKQLKGRDQIIVVDDAQSMKPFLSDILQLIGPMISLAKKAHPDGVALVFTSSPEELRKRSRLTLKSDTDALIDKIITRFAKESLPQRTNMEKELGTVLERIRMSGNKTSVYVLTDGVWNGSSDLGGGVEEPIKTLILRMKRYPRNRTDVTIQFIQFGEDETGKQRLAWLDDELPKSDPDLRGFDIVDTRRHNDNLYLLMIGALSRDVDEVKSSGKS